MSHLKRAPRRLADIRYYREISLAELSPGGILGARYISADESWLSSGQINANDGSDRWDFSRASNYSKLVAIERVR